MNVDVIKPAGHCWFCRRDQPCQPERIDGVECYHITFSLDMAKYLDNLGEAGVQIDAATSKGTGELWVGADDFLTRKFLFNLDATVQGVTVNASTL